MEDYVESKLYDTIKELAIIPESQLDEAFEQSQRQHVSFQEVLFKRDLVSDIDLGKIIANLLSLPYVHLASTSIPEDILGIIPLEFARKQRMIAFKKDTRGLHIAMVRQSNLEGSTLLKKKTGLNLIIYYATDRDIEGALALYGKNLPQTFKHLRDTNLNQTQFQNEPPITAIVDELIMYAYQSRASDIHIEPLEDATLIRYRIDGILHDIINVPRELHARIITRIKILSDLQTDEHQAAQDGKIHTKIGNEEIDIRISVVPIASGEKVVMRLLSERSRQFSLSDLGLSVKDLTKVEVAYQKPYGMILVTGPTGSGKTTTLYALLKLLNKREINIMTIEDPIEYEIDGVNQIQVNPKTNLTFAAGLRSIIRQDPNVILVGEIRDPETAGIAINSSMTGHLVMSSLHTNDAATAIPRLLDMSIEPFLVSSTVNIIIAQRLVRKICTKCRVSHLVSRKDLLDTIPLKIVKSHFDSLEKIRIYSGKGCSICQGSGYLGRVGIFEVMIVDDLLRALINERRDSTTLTTQAIKNGMTTMVDDGIEKVKQGITTISEVMRVTSQ